MSFHLHGKDNSYLETESRSVAPWAWKRLGYRAPATSWDNKNVLYFHWGGGCIGV